MGHKITVASAVVCDLYRFPLPHTREGDWFNSSRHDRLRVDHDVDANRHPTQQARSYLDGLVTRTIVVPLLERAPHGWHHPLSSPTGCGRKAHPLPTASRAFLRVAMVGIEQEHRVPMEHGHIVLMELLKHGGQRASHHDVRRTAYPRVRQSLELRDPVLIQWMTCASLSIR
ncbi:MAG: hypothetical protein KF751_15320 [Nitrospira sp.]|nr:hypothetical protein [Nitrospira sp.]